jgi:cytochrome c peroxidase
MLSRNTPTLWNVAFKARLMWDRRVDSLEAQALIPLLAPDEMAADPERLVARLAEIPEYQMGFARAFSGDEPVSLENVTRALAAFERTLLSQDSSFDRYARGERDALAPAERRGLTLFRSLNTRCFECHRLPTFEAPLELGVGVPSPDPGVGGVSGEPAQHGLFGVPTLRNVALTAPYMHDGSLPTLAAVVDFYRRGGGRAFGVDEGRVDGQVRAFSISDAEAADLVAFLGSLSDTAASPAIPERVPSGLPVLRMEAKP